MIYHRPDSLDEALTLLASDPDARCLAGGATLVAMMNADLVKPSALISLKDIEELRGISETEQGYVIGAMTPHCVVANDGRLRGGAAVIRLAANAIGHPAIRAVGTIGGSISHADPAADYPTALVAAAAQIEVASTRGRRLLSGATFFVDYYTTALQADEIVIAVHVPRPLAGSISAYRKVSRSDGDFATASVAFSGTFERGDCSAARVAIGGCAATPVSSSRADSLLIGALGNAERVARAAEILVESCDPVDDMRGTAEYRRTLVRRLVPRVFSEAVRSGSP